MATIWPYELLPIHVVLDSFIYMVLFIWFSIQINNVNNVIKTRFYLFKGLIKKKIASRARARTLKFSVCSTG